MWSLNEDKAADPSCCGGKGANLAQLIRAGYRVPRGVCLSPRCAELVAAGDSESLRALGALLSQLREPLAVRSSATTEDGARTSYAGQFVTSLGVGISGVESSVQRVVESKDSWHARRYANLVGETDTIEMAVLIQEIVDADSAGVAFSRHPVRGDLVTVIESVHGLGDILVAGEVVPDRVIVDRLTGGVNYELGSQRLYSRVRGTTGLIRESLPSDKVGRPSLTVRQARRISALAVEIERYHEGTPQDLEWALVHDEVYMLQARPITSKLR